MNALSHPDPFDLNQPLAYQHWSESKQATSAQRSGDLLVDVADPTNLSEDELQALLERCDRFNMVIYRSGQRDEDKSAPQQLARQLGLCRLDGHLHADQDGMARITVASNEGLRSAYIPYTNRPIKWHTDGYYHPLSRPIRAMLLHCVRPAKTGGETGLIDHEMAYIAVRDANLEWLRALMAPDAMTIPARLDDDGVARAEQSGPVFWVDPRDETLQMRYTARTRSVIWKDDALTREAVTFLSQWLEAGPPQMIRVRLESGMGLVCNNVLHDRTAFVDDPQQPRLLFRGRYLDRIATAAPVSRAARFGLGPSLAGESVACAVTRPTYPGSD